MKDSLTLNAISFINGIIHLPGSKSISNRALLLSAMSHGVTVLKNLLLSDDTRHMLNALKVFGINFTFSKNNTICTIKGKAQPLYINQEITLFLGNSGTSMRSLTAILSLSNNNILLTGDERMKERPIKHLVNALQKGGAIIKYSEKKNYPPIKIQGGFSGGNIIIDGSISSQFLTALLISAPLAILDSTIMVKGTLVSKPYIDITLKLIRIFGIDIKNDSYTCFYIKGRQRYISPVNYSIEGDASSASYFLAAAAIKGGSVCVTGIGKNSIQGDVKFSNILRKMGSFITIGNNFVCCRGGGELHGIDMNLNDIPDAAMTIAIVALFSIGNTIIRNIYNWRVKETDRLSAMSAELRKIGALIHEGNDYICISPPKKFLYASINTYNDHRIAMCFSLIALANTKITLLNPNCVNKTYPNYFKELNSISF
ncbi:MAG: 3-phosphoshikimate 1-carboxyvinyltransferase [Buchnera aphidicola (Schlechtendalia peitan)]